MIMDRRKIYDEQFELKKQLHEQYAMNNNERMSSLITLFVSLIIVIGAYGYMFLHTTLDSSPNLGKLFLGDDKYTVDVLLLTSSIAFIIIAVIQHLCIYQGAYQRKEQFIVYAIRCEVGLAKSSIFPDTYNPFEKTIKTFVQGIYGELVKLFEMMQFIMLFLTLWKYFATSANVSSVTYMCFILFLLCFFLSFMYIQIFLLKKYNDYKELEIKYKELCVK